MDKIIAAFLALNDKLEALYGAEHTHDFQDELDQLDAAIKENSNGDKNLTSGGPAPSKVSPVVGKEDR